MQYLIVMFGAMRAGLIVINVNPLYTADELIYQLNDADVDTLVVLENFAHTVQVALPKIRLKHIIVTEVGDLFPLPMRVLVNVVVKYIKRMVPAWKIPHVISLRHALREGQSLSLTRVELTGDDTAYLQYTGGTTGVSKGAILTHRNMIANVEQAAAWIKPKLTVGQEIIVTALPLYHIFSLTANSLVFLKYGALNVLITNPRDIDRFIADLRKVPFTAFTGVNTLFNALLNHRHFKKIDFNHLKISLGGGMAVQRDVAERWKQVTGCTLAQAYGLTEASPAVTINCLNLKEFNGSIGLPLPSTDISIRDNEGHELPVGEAGELCIKGPQVMKSYWNKPEETQKVFSDDGWLYTGDVAKMDEQGFIYLVDRIKDLIVVSGFNVYPNEVEDVIATHAGVLEVGVIGVPHDHSGEAVAAFIVRKDPNLDEKTIKQHCRKHLTAYKIPKKILFIDEIPKTAVGKILRRALRDKL